MANEIKYVGATGQTITANIMAGASVVASAISVTEASSTGVYLGSVPNGTSANDDYLVVLSNGACGLLRWDGTAEKRPNTTAPDNASVTAIKVKTDNLPAAPAAVSDIPTAVQNADALLNRDMSAGADSGSPAVRTPRQAFRAIRNKWSVSGGTLTVTKEDDSTASWTAAVSTTPGADPITGTDPA